MMILLNHQRIVELLVKLGRELGLRSKKDYNQLFSVDTTSKVYLLIRETKNTFPVFSDESLRRMLHGRLVEILRGMGNNLSPKESVHDDEHSLVAILEVISALNDDANRGVFIEHDLTCLTATIKAKLTRRLEALRLLASSHLE